MPRDARTCRHLTTGAIEIAGKLREAWKTHSTALDSLKADHAAAAKKVSASEKEAARLKADLDAAGKGTDERLTKLIAERHEFKTVAEQRAADLESHKLRTALADKLGIGDAKMRKRALDVFLSDYRPEGSGFDDKGELQGFDKPLEAFKKAEPFFFAAPDLGHGGGRQGADPAAKVGADKKGPTDKVVVFRVGVPGPVAGVIGAPLIEHTLSVTGARTAIGTVPTTDTDLDPGIVYGYRVSVGEGASRYLVVHGDG